MNVQELGCDMEFSQFLDRSTTTYSTSVISNYRSNYGPNDVIIITINKFNGFLNTRDLVLNYRAIYQSNLAYGPLAVPLVGVGKQSNLNLYCPSQFSAVQGSDLFTEQDFVISANGGSASLVNTTQLAKGKNYWMNLICDYMTDINDEEEDHFPLSNLIPNPAGGLMYPLSFDQNSTAGGCLTKYVNMQQTIVEPQYIYNDVADAQSNTANRNGFSKSYRMSQIAYQKLQAKASKHRQRFYSYQNPLTGCSGTGANFDANGIVQPSSFIVENANWSNPPTRDQINAALKEASQNFNGYRSQFLPSPVQLTDIQQTTARGIQEQYTNEELHLWKIFPQLHSMPIIYMGDKDLQFTIKVQQQNYPLICGYSGLFPQSMNLPSDATFTITDVFMKLHTMIIKESMTKLCKEIYVRPMPFYEIVQDSFPLTSTTTFKTSIPSMAIGAFIRVALQSRTGQSDKVSIVDYFNQIQIDNGSYSYYHEGNNILLKYNSIYIEDPSGHRHQLNDMPIQNKQCVSWIDAQNKLQQVFKKRMIFSESEYLTNRSFVFIPLNEFALKNQIQGSSSGTNIYTTHVELSSANNTQNSQIQTVATAAVENAIVPVFNNTVLQPIVSAQNNMQNPLSQGLYELQVGFIMLSSWNVDHLEYF